MVTAGEDTSAAAPRCAVVVVTYRSSDVVEDCLRALPEATRGLDVVGVVVADNASDDDTVARARRARPDVSVVAMGGNRGYAAAINAGAAAAPGHDYLLVLNPDTVPSPGCVTRLVEALASTPGAGLAVPRFRATDGTRATSLRREPSLLTAASEALLGGGRAGRLGLGEVVADHRRYERAGPTDWATGAAVLVGARCARAIGPWDESFQLYSEETDYMLRARDAGYLTWYVPDAVVAHRGGESATAPLLWSLVMVNKARLFRLRHRRQSAALYRAILLAGEASRAVLGRPRARAAVPALFRAFSRPPRLPG